MSTERILIMIAVSALCTFFLRALPFLAFGGSQKMPDWLDRLGKTLPSAIMAVLIVYCLKDVGSDVVHIGLPKIAAVVIVALSYKWKHNTLVSIAVGTAGYMILLRVAAMLEDSCIWRNRECIHIGKTYRKSI